MTIDALIKLTASLEPQLRAKGVAPNEVPGVLGAAFMASLLNLPPDERIAAINAHLAAIGPLLKPARD